MGIVGRCVLAYYVKGHSNKAECPKDGISCLRLSYGCTQSSDTMDWHLPRVLKWLLPEPDCILGLPGEFLEKYGLLASPLELMFQEVMGRTGNLYF